MKRKFFMPQLKESKISLVISFPGLENLLSQTTAEWIKAQIVESTDRILKRISALESKVEKGFRLEQEREEKIMASLDDLLVEAQRGTTVGDSVLALVQRLVDSAGGDPAKLQSILDTMKGENDKIEAAVLANTPQA